MLPGQRLLLLLRNNETAQSIAIAISVASLLIGLVFLFLEWPPSEIRAAAITNFSTIDYGSVTCVSIASRDLTVEGKETPDRKVAKWIADILSIKTVFFNAPYAACPWAFSINIAPGTDFAIHDGLLPAQYLVSVGICERINDRHMDPNKCLSKNVYVFNWRARPHDLFMVGIIGLRPETRNMEMITMKVDDD
jgi:hypothetical protein